MTPVAVPFLLGCLFHRTQWIQWLTAELSGERLLGLCMSEFLCGSCWSITYFL